MKNIKIINICTSHIGLTESLINAVIPVGHGNCVKETFHLRRIHKAKHTKLLVILGSNRLKNTTNLRSTGMNNRTIGHKVSAEEKVFAIILLKKDCATTCTQVEHKGYTTVGIINKVTVTVATTNKNSVDLIVCNKHILSELHSRNTGAATVLYVNAPSILSSDSVLNVAGRGGEGVFLPLLGDTEDNVNLKGINSTVFKTLYGCKSSHLLSAVTSLLRGYIFLINTKLCFYRILAPYATCSVGDLFSGHYFFRKVCSNTNDSYVCHCVFLSFCKLIFAF